MINYITRYRSQKKKDRKGRLPVFNIGESPMSLFRKKKNYIWLLLPNSRPLLIDSHGRHSTLSSGVLKRGQNICKSKVYFPLGWKGRDESLAVWVTWPAIVRLLQGSGGDHMLPFFWLVSMCLHDARISIALCPARREYSIYSWLGSGMSLRGKQIDTYKLPSHWARRAHLKQTIKDIAACLKSWESLGSHRDQMVVLIRPIKL